MSNASDTQVLIAGAGPVGVTAVIELARRGIACRIVDPLVEPPQYAKAVGVQRTLEVFEGMGVLRSILDAALLMRGQIVYGRRSSGSATASSTPTAEAGCSWRATPRTSTRPPVRRA
jgi:2-polyprenyl-6-methoxyphenol hydroxylase-like FAD-dependent oxidoreductase